MQCSDETCSVLLRPEELTVILLELSPDPFWYSFPPISTHWILGFLAWGLEYDIDFSPPASSSVPAFLSISLALSLPFRVYSMACLWCLLPLKVGHSLLIFQHHHRPSTGAMVIASAYIPKEWGKWGFPGAFYRFCFHFHLTYFIWILILLHCPTILGKKIDIF